MSADDKMHSGRDEYQRDDSNIRENMYAGLEVSDSITTTDQGNSHDLKGAKEKKKLFDVLVKNKDITKSADPNSQTLFIGSRFGHNVYDTLGHFNSINEIGMPIDMVDNDKLTYLSNGKQMVARVIYE